MKLFFKRPINQHHQKNKKSSSTQHWRRQLTSQKGESLAEALVALLIVALGILLLATTIIISTRLVENSNQRLHHMYTITNHLEKGTGDTLTRQPENFTIEIGTNTNPAVSKKTIQVFTNKSEKETLTVYSYDFK